MTEVRFYHLQRQPLEKALPKLLEKVLEKGFRAVVKAGSLARVDDFNAVFWTYSSAAFLPHGAAGDGHAERQPIWLTTEDENPNQANVLVLTDGAVSDRVADFAMCLEMFDGNNPDAVTCARDHWRLYKDAGHEIAYYQQTEKGGWELRN